LDVINDCLSYKVSEKTIVANFAGFFQQTWLSTGYSAGGANYTKLQAGKVYTVVSYICIATGAGFKTPVSFTVTVPTSMADMKSNIQDMQSTIQSTLDKPLSELNQELQATLAVQTVIMQSNLESQRQTIETKMSEQTQTIKTATTEMKTTIESSLTSFETKSNAVIKELQTGASKAVSAGETLEATAKKYSWNATVSPDPALTGDTITLHCQGQAGLLPMLDVYGWDNKTILNDVILQDKTGQGLYIMEFKADGRFMPGKAYTFVISEQTTGGIVAGSGMVESMSMTTIAGLASAAPEAERAAKKALDAIRAVEAVVVSNDKINIALTLKNLKDSVDSLPQAIAKEAGSSRIVQVINEISDRIKTLTGEQGYDFNNILEKALSDSPTVKDISNKTGAINEVVDIMDQVFERKFGGLDSPFVSTSLQSGSVRFRIACVNPSRDKTQYVEVKYYLPQEVKPNDIVDTAGLNLEYDSEKSIYYVYKANVELAPSEVRVFEVEVEDIWMIQQPKLNDIKSRTDEILMRLEESEKGQQYYDKAKEISDGIFNGLDEIASMQSDETVSRESHIGIYRQNLLTLNRIKEELARMEKILVTAGGPPAPEMLAKTKIKANEPTRTMTWFLIFVIIAFIGLLTAILFFAWIHQSRITKESIGESKKAAFPETPEKKGSGKE
jgi:hypothetical protein